MTSLVEYFRECCGDRATVNKYRKALTEAISIKDAQIQDLEKEISYLKKQRQCFNCGKKEDLEEFCPRLYKILGYPSYYYCKNHLDCLRRYISELEHL